MKSRILIIFCGFLLLWGLLLTRAALLQVFPNPRLTTLQSKQFQTVITLQNRRGSIIDRDGRELAVSTKVYSLYADPSIIESKKKVAKALSKIVGHSSESIYQKIKDSKKKFVWIERQMTREKSEEIASLDVRGLKVVEEFKRTYPNENLLSQVVGFVGKEGQGLEGLELEFDKELKGNQKKVTLRRDARGRPLIVDGMMFAENPEGVEIQLTIDSDLQHMLEKELEFAVSNFEASSAVGIILNAKTSEILAISSAPSFDLNEASKINPELRRNRAITDLFEPGSTLKTFVVATALKEKIIQPNTKYNTEGGKFKIGDRFIREAEVTEKWENLTVSEILAFSSNIGTTKIAMELGPLALRRGLEDFGFSAKTGVDLPGEAKGVLHSLPWRPHLLANISFGHGISANALQVANAYAVIANGGVLKKPYIIKSVRDPETGIVEEQKINDIRRVLSPEESASMRLMLAGVAAPGGTGVLANVEGFLIGGKTGTAQKVNPNGRGYLEGAYISSFAGFIPANEPEFVIYVAVDHPKKNAYYGSQVAAPIFSRLAGYAVRRAGLAPVLLTEKNFIDQRTAEPIKNQFIANRKRKTADVVNTAIDIEIKSDPFAGEKMPNWQDLPLREVLRQSAGRPFEIELQGQGRVAETIPAYGEEIKPGQKIRAVLRPRTTEIQ